MSDLYCEKLISRKPTAIDAVVKMVLIILTLAGLLLCFVSPFYFLLFVFMIAVDFICFPYMNVEYEYLYVNGEMDIDKIIGKAKRKKLLTFDVSQIEIMAPKGSHKLDCYQNAKGKTYDFTSRTKEEGVYLVIINKEQENLKVFIEADLNIAEGMKMYAPRRIFTEK